MASTHSRVRSLPFTSTFIIGQSSTTTDVATPGFGPRTTTNAPPASLSHPISVQTQGLPVVGSRLMGNASTATSVPEAFWATGIALGGRREWRNT